MYKQMKFRNIILLGVIFLLSCSGLLAQRIKNNQNLQKSINERPFPILAWHGPGKMLLTDRDWENMALAGFNLCHTLFLDTELNQKALTLGDKYGIGVLLRDPIINLGEKPQAKADIEEAVKQWMKKPGLSGYALKDEPGANAFAELARIKRIISDIDSNHRIYVNLFPDYASAKQLEKATYLKYVKRFMRKFKPDVLSYDYYSITKEEKKEIVRASYYENMEIIRKAAKKAKVPFSAFTLSIPHWDYLTPTEGHIRFQLFSALAYGAKELQYFTYGALPHIPDFPTGGLIDSAGNKTSTYGYASKINWEIQHMGPVLLDLESTEVFHTAPQPKGTKAFAGYGGLDKCSGEAVLGFVEDSEGQTWLMVVNRNPFGSAVLTLSFSDDVTSVGEFDRTQEGCIVNEVELVNQQLVLPLTAGDGRLFRIDTDSMIRQ